MKIVELIVKAPASFRKQPLNVKLGIVGATIEPEVAAGVSGVGRHGSHTYRDTDAIAKSVPAIRLTRASSPS